MDSTHSFKWSLLRMLQAGTLQRIIGCADGACARIEFRLASIYHVHFTPQYIALHERESETIRHHRNGRWRTFRPSIIDRGRIIIERATGKIIQTTPAGRDDSHD